MMPALCGLITAALECVSTSDKFDSSALFRPEITLGIWELLFFLVKFQNTLEFLKEVLLESIRIPIVITLGRK